MTDGSSLPALLCSTGQLGAAVHSFCLSSFALPGEPFMFSSFALGVRALALGFAMASRSQSRE